MACVAAWAAMAAVMLPMARLQCPRRLPASSRARVAPNQTGSIDEPRRRAVRPSAAAGRSARECSTQTDCQWPQTSQVAWAPHRQPRAGQWRKRREHRGGGRRRAVCAAAEAGRRASFAAAVEGSEAVRISHRPDEGTHEGIVTAVLGGRGVPWEARRRGRGGRSSLTMPIMIVAARPRNSSLDGQSTSQTKRRCEPSERAPDAREVAHPYSASSSAPSASVSA